MSNYNTQLQSNNIDLQTILNTINELPEAGGGTDLPELSNEGSASDLLQGKELIDSDGNKITGTFTIDNELTTQDDLIAQIKATVNSLPDAGSGGGSVETCTISLIIINGSTFYYINDKNELSTTSNGMVTISDVSTNSICMAVAGNGGFGYVTQSGNCTLITSTNTIRVYHIMGDCQIEASGVAGGAGGGAD